MKRQTWLIVLMLAGVLVLGGLIGGGLIALMSQTGEASTNLEDANENEEPADKEEEGQTNESDHESEVNSSVAYEPFQIRVVDPDNHRGIPMVTLKTVNHIPYITDSAGYVAFYEPGLMNEDVWFYLESDGYSHDYESLGSLGRTLSVEPGGKATLVMKRENIAERLYRITGQGIYRDSVLLGLDTPIKEPLLGPGKVMGQDTVQTIIYKDKLYWFWGDTNKPSHELGNFRTTGATSELPENGGLDPDVGVDLNYMVGGDGHPKQLVPQLPGDPNLAWVSGPMTTEDEKGEERLLITYSILSGLDEEHSSGILVWVDKEELFSERYEFDMDQRWKHTDGQTTLYEEDGKEYWIFNEPWPVKRVINEFDAIIDMESYESFTPLKPGTTFQGANTKLNRDQDGNLVWEWRKDTPAISQEEEADLIEYGLMTEEEAYFQLKAVDRFENGGKSEVLNHSGSVKWNDYKGAWVNIIEQRYGTSFMGEIWYAEAPTITGPWTYAKKTITHEEVDFYNIARHDYFDKHNGQEIYFEGTYVAMFGSDKATPYYDYNQIMYKLDLSDDRLSFGKVEEE